MGLLITHGRRGRCNGPHALTPPHHFSAPHAKAPHSGRLSLSTHHELQTLPPCFFGGSIWRGSGGWPPVAAASRTPTAANRTTHVIPPENLSRGGAAHPSQTRNNPPIPTPLSPHAKQISKPISTSACARSGPQKRQLRPDFPHRCRQPHRNSTKTHSTLGGCAPETSPSSPQEKQSVTAPYPALRYQTAQPSRPLHRRRTICARFYRRFAQFLR